ERHAVQLVERHPLELPADLLVEIEQAPDPACRGEAPVDLLVGCEDAIEHVADAVSSGRNGRHVSPGRHGPGRANGVPRKCPILQEYCLPPRLERTTRLAKVHDRPGGARRLRGCTTRLFPATAAALAGTPPSATAADRPLR